MKRLAKLAARGAGASLALALAVVALRGCSSGEDDAAEPTDAGAEETSLDAPAEAKPSDAPVSDGFAGSGGSDGNVDCPGPIPDDVPTGWVKVPVAACWYDLYGPPDASLLPKGLKWQECSDLGPSTYTCRELVVDWQDEAGTPVGGIPYATVLPNGEVLLQVRKLLTRFLGGMKQAAAFDLIVEADGPVRQAFYSSWNSYQYPAFVLIRTGISATTTGWQILQNQVGKTVGNLVLGGKNDALTLPVLHAFNEGDLSSGALRPGSAFYALSGSHLDVYRWDGEHVGMIYQGLDISNPIWIGDTLLWSAQSTAISQIWTWTEKDGAHELISFGNDLTRGVANAFTDGTDLVWLQGEDRTGPEGFYPTRSVMSAKFSSDPGAIKPVRLRSWPDPSVWGGYTPDAVGCGYAALAYNPAVMNEKLMIVRLADGVSWILDSPPDRHWTWGKPVAVTCDEVFTTWGKPSITNLRRIRLSSLGPGIPPD
ncbi:MAG: hypothetical protein KC776_19545 [Myxococcales bacterium]|nr:hypothetical protein [Myxococcales bacterium]MCB9578892.1 hypothetical protein [Polyangiaceae bacterium]